MFFIFFLLSPIRVICLHLLSILQSVLENRIKSHTVSYVDAFRKIIWNLAFNTCNFHGFSNLFNWCKVALQFAYAVSFSVSVFSISR